MVDAKKCDVCDKFYLEVSLSDSKGYNIAIDGSLLDLCPDCLSDLDKFVQERKSGNFNKLGKNDKYQALELMNNADADVDKTGKRVKGHISAIYSHAKKGHAISAKSYEKTIQLKKQCHGEYKNKADFIIETYENQDFEIPDYGEEDNRPDDEDFPK